MKRDLKHPHQTGLQNPLRRSLLALAAISPAIALMGCGYRMRGMVDVPYKAIAITGNPSPPLRADLQRVILTGTDTKVAINPKDADLILEITNDSSAQEILAYNSNGQISAYRLTIRAGFRAYDTAGAEIVPDAEIYVTRAVSYTHLTLPTKRIV